jgi:hypothetical protein
MSRATLDLQRVGVLELVDHQVEEALLEPGAHALVVAQRVARLHQQVEEVEHAALGLAPLVDLDDALERAHEAAVEVGAERRRPALARLPGPAGDLAPFGQRLGRGPVRLEAEARLDRLEPQHVLDALLARAEARGFGELWRGA